jgi:hypothetical protein
MANDSRLTNSADETASKYSISTSSSPAMLGIRPGSVAVAGTYPHRRSLRGRDILAPTLKVTKMHRATPGIATCTFEELFCPVTTEWHTTYINQYYSNGDEESIIAYQSLFSLDHASTVLNKEELCSILVTLESMLRTNGKKHKCYRYHVRRDIG